MRNSKLPKRGNLNCIMHEPGLAIQSLNSELTNPGGQVVTHFPKNRDLIHE
jgi:hypothetical protein